MNFTAIFNREHMETELLIDNEKMIITTGYIIRRWTDFKINIKNESYQVADEAKPYCSSKVIRTKL